MNVSGDCALAECCKQLVSLASHTHTKTSKHLSDLHTSRDNIGAVAYTICILVLFGSLILLLMVRAIRPRDDEQAMMQVNSVLCSMRVRVDREDNRRRQRQLRDAKKSAQKWLGEIAARRMSFRRAHSDVMESVRSLPLRHLKPRVASRATSYQGYLPEIVVTGEPLHSSKQRTSSSRSISRQSSVFSYEEMDDAAQDSPLS